MNATRTTSGEGQTSDSPASNTSEYTRLSTILALSDAVQAQLRLTAKWHPYTLRALLRGGGR